MTEPIRLALWGFGRSLAFTSGAKAIIVILLPHGHQHLLADQEGKSPHSEWPVDIVTVQYKILPGGRTSQKVP